MATNDYGIVEKQFVSAQTDHALNRSVVSATAIENGFIFQLATKSATSGNKDVFVATVPATSYLSNLWMLAEPPVALIASRKGLTRDPREYILAIGDVGSAYKPQLGDVIKVSDTALAGSANDFVVATNAAWQLTYAAAVVSGLSFKVLDASAYISLADGAAIGSQREDAVLLECVALA